MKQLLSLLLSLSLAIPAHADDCSKPVVPLDKGAQAPCKGFLFSPDQEHKMYLLDQDHQLLQQQLDGEKKLVQSYQKSLKDFQPILDDEQKKSELWRKAAEDSTQKLVEIKDNTGKRDLLMIGLGVLLTIGAGFALHQADRSMGH